MAVWQCGTCGYEKEGRCKPKKCPGCGESGSFAKKEGEPAGGCGCASK